MKAEASLRKCAPSCRYRCENSPWRAAPGPRHPKATRYSRQNGPRTASAFQRDALGQETTHWGRQFAYPNALLPTPMRKGTPRCLPQCTVTYPNAGRHATLPTPMREGTPRCLPQCTVTYPNAGARPPAALSAPRLLRAPLRIWAGVVQNASGFRCFRRAPHVGGPKCVWVSLFSVGSAREWSEMRLGLTVLAGSGWIRSDSDAFWTTRQPSPRSRPRLRRILDHRTAGAPGH